MLLWHMHSEVLAGFYASEVYVTASHKEHAVQSALDAFNAWIQGQVEAYWFNPLTVYQSGEPEYPDELARLQISFMREAHEKLKQVPNNAIIFRRT